MKHEFSCGALVYRMNGNAREYLILHQSFSGTWSAPKGHMEKGETRADTARREVFEETGIRVYLEYGFEKHTTYMLRNNVPKTLTLFLARTNEEPVLNSECSEYRWVSAEEAKKKLPPFYRHIVDKAEAKQHVIGKRIPFEISRVAGSSENGVIYRLNCGVTRYGTDCILLGIERPVRKFYGKIIAQAFDPQENRIYLLMSPSGMEFDKDSITASLEFLQKELMITF